MFLTQLVLNPDSRTVLNDITDSYKLHRRVMTGFPVPLPAGERILYRLDYNPHSRQIVLLIQSHTPSDWKDLEQTDYLLQPATDKFFSPSFSENQVFQFRLAANPTKRLGAQSDKCGYRVGLLREVEQKEWLTRKALMNGFRVLNVGISKCDQPDGWKYDQKSQKWLCIRQHGVRFDGLLTVTDAVKFSLAFCHGIGSGKGMGYGLLSLMCA